MPDTKHVTLGVTINPERYEKVRLDVEGDVGSLRDAEELVEFPDTLLSQLGRGDAVTAGRVDSYRNRVLGKVAAGEGKTSSKAGASPPPEGLLKDVRRGSPPSGTSSALNEISQKEPPRIWGNATVPVSAIPSDTTGIRIDNCRSAITPSEQKMSKLLSGKNLSRTCLKGTR